MSAKRSLSAVLNKLCSVEYLTEKKPLQFCLAKNGLNLKKNIVNSMIMGRSDLLTVSNEKDAMKQLKKGTLYDIFNYNVCNEKKNICKSIPTIL